MARIQKKSPKLDLNRYQTLVIDTKNNSEYFRLSEVPDTLTSGKNGFLIEGSTFLKPTTEIKIEVIDSEGNPLYVQPGEGIPEYYEGLSKLISIHVYEDTPIGIGKITILGEADTYIDENGLIKSVPDEWRGIYNVKWEKEIKINKNLLNETKVRFIKRPEIIVEELGESLFSKTISSATQTNGTIKGIAVTPALGTNLKNYAGGIIYHLKNESIPFQDGAKTISVSGTQIQTASVVEYINQYTLAVRVPHTTSQYIVGDFNGANYELNYEYASSVQESSLFGSFARFEINNLTTFVGDVERIKLYGKSNATSADYNLIYDARINSQNLLETIVSGSVIDRGFFSASYGDTRTWNTYWSTQSLSGTSQISLDTNDLYKSVKFRNYKVKTDLGNDIRLEKDSEYTLEFYVYYKTPSQEFLSNPNDSLKIYAASGLRQGNGFTPNYYFTTSLDTLTGDNKWRNPIKISYNFIPNVTDDWSINFEALNEDTPFGDTFWQVGSVKIYGSNELGYSPDEFGFTIPIQRQLEQETFDFRLEYYDLNNNFVPIQNIATQTFVSGNISLLGKSIDLSVDKLFFTFDGNESAVPSNQTINFFANKTKILGNLLITSQAFDSGGVYIPPATFGASPYPGNLTSIYETSNEFSASLTVSDFNGPLYSAPPGPGDLNVDRILYTITEGSSTQPIIKRISVARIVAGSGSAGAPGAAGSDAKVVTLTANIYTIPYDGNGTEIGTNNIFLTASQQNHSGTVYYEYLKNGVSKQNTTSQFYTILSVDEPTTSSVDLWRVNTREGSSGGSIIAFDTINLFGVKAGSDAYTVLLSNESHVLPVSNTGVVNYTGSGTDIQVYKGATELTGILSGTPISGQFSSSYIVTNGSVSVGQVSLSGNKIRFNSHSVMGTDNATIAYSVYLEGLATNFTKIQSLAKSFEGNDGANGASGSDARVVSLTSDRYVFTYDQNSNIIPTPQTASISASAQNINVAYYQFLKNGAEVQNTTNAIYVITGSSIIPAPGARDLYQVNLRTGSAAGAVLAFDNIDIFGIKSGSDAYTVFLTNEAHTFAANDTGIVNSSEYSAGITQVRFFRGITQYTYDQTNPYGVNTYRTGSVIYSPNITASSTEVNNDLQFTPTNVVGNAGQLSGSIIIPLIDNATNTTFNKNYTFSISKAGVSGSNALTILLNPTNQTVSKSKAGLYQSPLTFSIQVFETGSPLLYTGSNNTLQNGYFTIHLRNSAGTLIPATGSTSASIIPPVVTSDSGISSSFAVQYKDSKGSISSFISQSHYVTVVREGNDGINGASGSDAFSVSLVSNRYTFTYEQNGILTPLYEQTSSLTASAQTGSGARPWTGNLFYQFQKNGTTVSPSNYSSPFWIVTESVGSSAIPSPGAVDIWQVNLLSGSGQTRVAFDSIDLVGLKSGSDAFTVFLTNEAHTFPSDDKGIVDTSNLIVGATDIRFYRGIVQYTHDQTAPYNTNSYRTGSVTFSSNITASQTIVNNDVRFTPTSVTGSTQTSGSIIIPIIDNSTSTTFTKIYTFSVSKEGTDAYTVILTNEAHTLPTTNTGTVTYTNSGTSIIVYKGDLELNSVSGTPTTNQFSVSAAVTTGTITVGAITVTGNPAVVADHSNMTTDLAIIEYTINIENLVSIKKYQSLAKSIQGNDGNDGNDGTDGNNAITILVTPETQIVSQSVYYNLFSSASKFDIFVYETGSALTYTTTQPPTANSTFTVYAGNNGQTNLSVNNNKSGSIRPPHTTTGTGSINQFSIQYKDSKGVVSQQISASHIVNVNRTGTTGPGVVFTGQWSSSRFYQYTDGAVNGRRDVVVSGSNNRYYATLQSHTAGASNYPTDGANNAFWEFLGTEDYFVAAKIAIFEESYVRNTLNIGTNGSIDVEGAPAKANITIYGNTTSPYIAIGQTVQGYNQKGIWLGNDAGNFKMSLTSGSSNFLTWDGSNLSIGGSITVTGGNAATQTYADQAEADAISTAASDATTKANTAESNSKIYTLSQTASLSSSVTPRIRTDNTGRLINATGTTPSVTGLYLGDDNLGYYNTSTGWRTYMNSSGDFYLGGTAGALTWTGGTLTVQGTINVTGGTASTKAYANDAASSAAKSASLADVVVNPSANVLIDSGKIYKIAGGANAEDTEVYSKVGYKNSAYVKIKPGANANNSFFGLDTTPSEAISSNNLDYAWYFFNNKSYIRRGSTSIGEYPAGVNWAETDDFTIEYDGGLGKIRWFKNGTEQYSEDATKDLTYYFDSILYTSNTSLPILNYFEFGAGIPGSAYLSGSLTPRIRTDSSGRLINAAGSTPSTNGLYLGNDYLGYYFGGWKTYMDSSGQFFLSGTGVNSLSWNGSTLDIVGTVKSSIVSASNFVGGTGDFSGDINASNIIANQGTIAGLTLNNSELLSSNNSMSIDAGDSALKIFSGSETPVIAIRTGAPQSLDLASTSSVGDVPELSSSGISGTRFYGASGLNTNGTTTTWVINPGNEGQYSGKFKSTNSNDIISVTSFTGTVTVYLYLDIASNSSFSSNLSTFTLASAYYNRPYSSGPTNATAALVPRTADISVNFSTSGTWYVRLRWNASGYPGQGSYTISSVTSTTSNEAGSASTLTLTKSVSITEITAGGFQVIRDSNNYVRSSRQGTSTIMLEVGGEIRATGEITAFASTSDRRLKENILPIDSALDKIGKLNGVEFDWKSEWLEKKGGEDGFLVRRHDVGIIAQEIEEVLPEVVGTRPDGYKAVKYEKIVPLLIESIKEQQKIILNLSASLVETMKKVL